MTSNLWLLLLMLGKVLLVTGLGPGFIAICLVAYFYDRRKVSTRAKVLAFSRWGEQGLAFGRRNPGTACIAEAGARPYVSAKRGVR